MKSREILKAWQHVLNITESLFWNKFLRKLFLRERMKIMVFILNNCPYPQNEVESKGQEVKRSQRGSITGWKLLVFILLTINRSNEGYTSWDQIFPSAICRRQENSEFQNVVSDFSSINQKQLKRQEPRRTVFLHMYLFLDKCVCLKVWTPWKWAPCKCMVVY